MHTKDFETLGLVLRLQYGSVFSEIGSRRDIGMSEEEYNGNLESIVKIESEFGGRGARSGDERV